jgi:hypothetical protein
MNHSQVKEPLLVAVKSLPAGKRERELYGIRKYQMYKQVNGISVNCMLMEIAGTAHATQKRDYLK